MDTPWLNFKRTTWPKLKGDLSSEVAIIGAGISGVATLYYLMTFTEKKVVLFEKNRVASGATSHNAGLAIVHIEKRASELVRLLGKGEMEALFTELDEAWEALHAIHEEIELKDNLLSLPHFVNGFNSLTSFFSFLKEAFIRESSAQTGWRFLVVDSLEKEIEEEYLGKVEFVPQETILEAVKTIDPSYIAAAIRIAAMKGKRMNSARFCYSALTYLKEKFEDRFSLYEETEIDRIDLYDTYSVLRHSQGKVTAQEVILCTNAYTDFTIWDQIENKPVTKLQESITPRIGFLAAYPPLSSDRYAIGFMNEQEPFKQVPFWYFSHAPHPNHDPNHSCVIGGPEFDLSASPSSEWIRAKELESLDLIKKFLKATFKEAPSAFPFFWHGWMGYTPSGLRWVGPDTEHPHLWYNLACNGIGIVPAIAGAKKIASLIRSQYGLNPN